MTMIETMAYRAGLIADLMGHGAGALRSNAGGWVTDRVNAIRECEWDLAEAGADFGRPFNLSHELIRRGD